MDAKDLVKQVKEDGVKFISLQFTDVTGAVKSVDMPISGLDDALEDGVWFDGSSVEGFARIQESDMHLRLDPDTYAVLPWTSMERRRARIFCDIFTPDALEAIHYLSHGVARQINRLGDLALLVGYADRLPQLAAHQIESVSEELVTLSVD